MRATVHDDTDTIVDFIGHASPPAAARARAAAAFQDTVGVILAGVHEPASRIARALAVEEGKGPEINFFPGDYEAYHEWRDKDRAARGVGPRSKAGKYRQLLRTS